MASRRLTETIIQSNDRRIKELREELKTLISSWHQTKHNPPRYQRLNGLGYVVCYVNPWHSYKNIPNPPKKPLVISWLATTGTRTKEGKVLLKGHFFKLTLEEAIDQAKRHADVAYVRLRKEERWEDNVEKYPITPRKRREP